MEEPAPEDTAPATLTRAVADEIEARKGEAQNILETGPRLGNRSGALAFLAFVTIIAAIVHFYLAEQSLSSYIYRLHSELLNHAELTVSSMDGGSHMAVVPSWPLRLYETLRRDIAIYTAMVALAAYLWYLSSRSRARRDAFLVHDQLTKEITELRQRLDLLEKEK